MKYKLLLMLLLLISIFVCSNKVQALSMNDINDVYVYKLDNINEKENCNALFGDPDREGTVANWLQKIFNFIKFLGPILVIVLSIVEFFKAMVSDDKDALVKAGKKTFTRIILALILFFLPYLINFFFRIFGWYGTCSIK